MKPDYPVTTQYDGSYKGERFDVSGSSICEPTEISGTVANGEVRLRLHYNGTVLTGWIYENGDLVLKGDNPKWSYRFLGKATDDGINGEWSVGNAPCNGTWYVSRQS